MTVAEQTITRTDLRVYSFTRDSVLEGNRDHVFSHDPFAAIMLGRDLGDFGPTKMTGAGNSDQPGGHTIQFRVRLGKHTGAKRMAGPTDTHSVDPDDNTRLAEANWTHYSGALVISDSDKGYNRGPDQMADFIEDQTIEVLTTSIDQVAADLQTSNSAVNAVTSMDDLIAAGSSTVQGLSAGTYSLYASRGLSARDTAPGSVSFASGSFAAQGISNMRTGFNNASEGTYRPNAIITTYDVHQFYEGVLQPQERFMGAVNVADASFQSLAFRTVPVLASPNTPGGFMWFVRVGKDGVEVKFLEGFSFHFADFKSSTNQETHVSELQIKAQQMIHNRRFGNNKMTGITA